MKKLIGSALLAAGILCGTTGLAHADANGYIQDLNDAGVVITDLKLALQLGQEICEALNYTNGSTLALELADKNRTLTPRQAASVIIAAGDNLCPWQKHDNKANTKVA